MRKKAFAILFIAATIMYYPLIKYLYRYLILDIDGGFLKELGFFSSPSSPWYAWLLAMILGLAYAFFTAKKVQVVKENWNELSFFNLFNLIFHFF